MKIRRMGAELFLADGRTDMMKLKVTFLNFANAPESGEGKFVPLLNQQPLHNELKIYSSAHDIGTSWTQAVSFTLPKLYPSPTAEQSA